MFHWKNEIFFGRRENGDVRIIKFKEHPIDWPDPEKIYHSSDVDFDQTIPANSWGSIVASVSLLGEEGGRWYEAMNFHNGKEASR